MSWVSMTATCAVVSPRLICWVLRPWLTWAVVRATICAVLRPWLTWVVVMAATAWVLRAATSRVSRAVT